MKHGDAPYMKRRRIPNAIRFHKIKDKNSHEWLYSEILLYHPFQNESTDLADARQSKDICEDMFLHPATSNSIAEDKNAISLSNVIKVRRKVMPFLEDVQEAREQIAFLNTEKIGEQIDSENVQDNIESTILEPEIHPDYETQHPDFFAEPTIQKSTTASAYRKIDLWDAKDIRTQLCKLDPDQRYIIDEYIKYARTSRLAENGFCTFPDPHLLVVEGDGGSGKSELIRTLCQVMEKEFRRAGDDPDHPYLLRGSFTGEAATNIQGQTLTSLFNLSFGNKLSPLADRIRDNKRELLQNLRLIIIEEYSMVKSDMLYQIDLRLKEIKIRPQDSFGGVSVIMLGNILQLPPVKGHAIYEEPACADYKFSHHIQSLWKTFTPIKLRYNHRQEGEAAFAETLKRVARGIKTDEDRRLLQTRVFPKDDPEIPKDTLYVFPRKKDVKEYNDKMINQLEGELEVLEATNIMATRKEFFPQVDSADGKVVGTPLVNVLYLKKGAKIVINHNIDVCDGLNNGAKGKILDFIRKDGKVTHIVVEFDNKEAGKNLKKKQEDTFHCLYENGIAIPRLTYSYNISKRKGQEGQKAICIQFPLMLANAMTIHKIQGGTVEIGNTLTSNFKGIFGPCQAYTVLSRVKRPDQLYLLEALYEDKIYTSKKALKTLRDIENRAINANYIGRREDQIKIVLLNVQYLCNIIEDGKCHHILHDQNLPIFS